MKKIVIVFVGIFLLTSAISAKAEVFSVSGKVKRTLVDATRFGGCMIALSSPLGHGCPGSWVSLDCKGGFYPESNGNKIYASAIVAASTGKQVTVQFDNTKKASNYCVAHRLDVIF